MIRQLAIGSYSSILPPTLSVDNQLILANFHTSQALVVSEHHIIHQISPSFSLVSHTRVRRSYQRLSPVWRDFDWP